MTEPASGRIVDAGPSSKRDRGMEEACVAAFGRFDPVRGAEGVRGILSRRDRGELQLGYWETRDGELAGCVAWEAVRSVGRRIALWFLEERHLSAESAGEMLRAFEELEPLAGPTFLVPDALPGLPLEAEADVLGPAGMVHFERERMVFPRGSEVPAAPLGSDWSIRHPTPEDATETFEVACRAYWDYPGQLEWPGVDLERDLALYVGHLRDRQHTVVPEATFVVLVQGQIRGNVVTRRDPTGPYIDSIQVDPRWHGRGLGRALMVRALEALRAGGPPEVVRLTYLQQNERAGALYRSMGFQVERVPRDVGSGYWVRQKTLRAVLDRPANTKYR